VGVWRSIVATRWTTPAWAANGDPTDFADVILAPSRFAALSEYYRRILADLDERLERRGTALELVYLSLGPDPGERASAQNLAVDMLRERAVEIGASVRDTRPLFDRCSECFLPGDGHYSAEGHRRLADQLRRWLQSGDGSGATVLETASSR
jgi:hypothetical protein